MTRRAQRLFLLYLGLLLVLAGLGAANQQLYRQQVALMTQKAVLQVTLSDLRRDSAGITGALAVRQWARQRGMIAVPNAREVRDVAPIPPPILPVPEGGLEVYTVWR
jgi:hypothetical protein